MLGFDRFPCVESGRELGRTRTVFLCQQREKTLLAGDAQEQIALSQTGSLGPSLQLTRSAVQRIVDLLAHGVDLVFGEVRVDISEWGFLAICPA